MPYSLQSRLLRVLQARTVTPLGSAKEVAVDFALVCATNRNLRDMVGRGAFREDLYYRINGLLVTLPPLRERTDLAIAVDQILRVESFSGRRLSVAADVLALFARHQWPGNFRQLTNVLRTASAMLDDGESTIGMRHLPQDFLDELRLPCSVEKLPAANLASRDLRLDDVTSSAVAAALTSHQGNVSAAARTLGVSRSTLYRKMATLPGAVGGGEKIR